MLHDFLIYFYNKDHKFFHFETTELDKVPAFIEFGEKNGTKDSCRAWKIYVMNSIFEYLCRDWS